MQLRRYKERVADGRDSADDDGAPTPPEPRVLLPRPAAGPFELLSELARRPEGDGLPLERLRALVAPAEELTARLDTVVHGDVRVESDLEVRVILHGGSKILGRVNNAEVVQAADSV